MRRRLIYFGLTVLMIGLGLASRRFMGIFPTVIAPFVGDALWAGMVYFGFRFLFPRLGVGKRLLVAFAFSYLIEFSQLYQADWINHIRATTLGALVLGHGFLYEDLISYAIGIIVAFGLDYLLKLD